MAIFTNKKTRLELAKELLEKLGTRDRHLKMVERSAMGYALKGLKEVVMEEALGSMDELMESTAMLYASAFDKQDLLGMLSFFNSKIGQKFLDAGGALEKELSELGIKWSRLLLERSEERYQKEYFKRKAEEGIVASDYIPPLNIKFH